MPLAASRAGGIWFAGAMFVHIVLHSTAPLGSVTQQSQDPLLLALGALRAPVGISVIARRSAQTPGEVVRLAVGMLGCVFVLFDFGRGLLSP